jgi:hypothetical protein
MLQPMLSNFYIHLILYLCICCTIEFNFDLSTCTHANMREKCALSDTSYWSLSVLVLGSHIHAMLDKDVNDFYLSMLEKEANNFRMPVS